MRISITQPILILTTSLLLLCAAEPGSAQDSDDSSGKTSSEQSQTSETDKPNDADKPSDAETAKKVKDKVTEIGKTLGENDTAKEVSGGILEPIYGAATYLSFPAFHWFAFALMTAGVVSYLLQLVLAKLFLLLKMSLDIKEVLGDFLGLLVSAVGLVLTTQASTQNSTFTHSPVAVISATIVGVIVGFVFYTWGQKKEFDAVRGARKTAATKD
jgi:hypothetical protein